MAETLVTLTGPLFEGRISANIQGGFRIGMQRIGEAEREAGRKQLGQRSRFRTAKYGHAAESLRTKITRVGGDEYEVASYIGGPSKYLGYFLEFGTKRHDIPKVGVVGKGNRRAGQSRGGRKILHFNGVFRRFLDKGHPGTPAYHWAEHATAEVARTAPGILEQALAEQIR